MSMWILAVPFIVTGLLALSFFFLLFKRWKTAGVLLLLALGLNFCSEWFPVHIGGNVSQDTGHQFTVLSYNVNQADDKDVYRYLDTLEVDMLFLQEPLGLKDTSRLVRHYPYRAGEMVLSKHPVRNCRRYRIEKEDERYDLLVDSVKNRGNVLQEHPSVFSMDVDMPQGVVRVISVHLRSNAYSTARRAMDPDAPWTDGVESYYENIRYGYLARGIQADMIRSELDSLSLDMPTLVVGDFNDVNGSYAIERIKGDRLRDAWWSAGLGFGTTYDGWRLKLRLDHILYSKEFEVEDVRVLTDFRHSDHLPLKAVLRWR